MNASTNRTPTLSVVVPAYNEAATLAEVVHKLLDLPGLLEIIVVDNGSNDRTPEVTAQLAQSYPQVRISRLERNAGKTGAVKVGLALTSGDIVIVQDADLEYDPVDIPGMLQPIIDGHADVVYGSRFLVRKAARVLYYYHLLANRALTFVSNLLTNLNMTDIATGYKAFRGEIIRNMIITSSGFGFEFEVTAKVAKLRCAIYEVPISYYARTYEEGKKIHWGDGFRALWDVFRFNVFWSCRDSFRQMPAVTQIASKYRRAVSTEG
jgi:glycosyltransferase involved in cell wall biosynthesis